MSLLLYVFKQTGNLNRFRKVDRLQTLLKCFGFICMLMITPCHSLMLSVSIKPASRTLI